jgi:hypothetical protein
MLGGTLHREIARRQVRHIRKPDNTFGPLAIAHMREISGPLTHAVRTALWSEMLRCFVALR